MREYYENNSFYDENNSMSNSILERLSPFKYYSKIFLTRFYINTDCSFNILV